MGLFLSLTSVVGKKSLEVVESLRRYTIVSGGGLKKDSLSTEHDNCAVIEEANGNTTIFNPHAFLDWEDSSEFISNDLKASVFSFHIHDGDLWMYTLYHNGELIDQFNPIPDYWDENISQDDINILKGSASKVAKLVPGITPADIEKYLVHWDLEDEGRQKAYEDDEFYNEEWQLLDFMRKLGLPYPLDVNGAPKGEVYKLWTKELPLKKQAEKIVENKEKITNKVENKQWWKFW
jgi:hypothetical protein